MRELIGRLVPRPGAAFPDSHAALTYAARGDEASLSRLIDGLRVLDAGGQPTAGTMTLPLVHALVAFRRGEYDEALRWFERIKDELVRLGGSHAENEVFEDTQIETDLRAGRYDEAEAWLRRRLDRRPSARDYFWLGRAQAARGDAGAASSLTQGRAHWSSADADSRELAALAALEASLSQA